MKKTTFIATLLTLMVMLTGCGEDNNKRIQELTQELANANATIETLSNEEASQQADEADTTVVIEQVKSEKIPLIPLDQENIGVIVLHQGRALELKPTKDLSKSVNENIVDIYTGTPERDLDLVISGISVKAVYVVDVTDGSFKMTEELTYDSVDNTYMLYYRMPGAGNFTFLIESTNGIQYFASVKYD